jgi:hypothetical protein
MKLLAALVLCRRNGTMECWKHGLSETETKVSRGKNNGQKRITSVFVYPMNRIIFQPDGTPMVPIFSYSIFSRM